MQIYKTQRTSNNEIVLLLSLNTDKKI